MEHLRPRGRSASPRLLSHPLGIGAGRSLPAERSVAFRGMRGPQELANNRRDRVVFAETTTGDWDLLRNVIAWSSSPEFVLRLSNIPVVETVTSVATRCPDAYGLPQIAHHN